MEKAAKRNGVKISEHLLDDPGKSPAEGFYLSMIHTNLALLNFLCIDKYGIVILIIYL